jgi:hypothetical protein
MQPATIRTFSVIRLSLLFLMKRLGEYSPSTSEAQNPLIFHLAAVSVVRTTRNLVRFVYVLSPEESSRKIAEQ